MVINKTTSDALLVSSLRIFGSNKKPITGATEFDTDTMQVTLSVGGPETAGNFQFYAASDQEVSDLVALLEVESEYLLLHISKKTTGLAKKAMDDADNGSEELLVQVDSCGPALMQCTNCGTHFILFVTSNKEVWSTTRTNPTDKWLTATQMDPDNITCDNCSNDVTVFEIF